MLSRRGELVQLDRLRKVYSDLLVDRKALIRAKREHRYVTEELHRIGIQIIVLEQRYG